MPTSDQPEPSRRGPLVVSLPGETADFAAELADRLGGEAIVLSAEEIVSPGDPEYVVGAVVGGSVHMIHADVLTALGVTEDALAVRVAEATARNASTARNADAMRRARVGDLPRTREFERDVIVVDDGSAAIPVLEALALELSRRGARSIVLQSPGRQKSPPKGYDDVRGIALTGAG